MHAWLGSVVAECSGVRGEVLEVFARLDMLREIARVLTTLDDEDLEGGVCGG